MLAIKLKRIGKKKQASFRVVVAERRSKLNGRSLEDLGWSNPRSDTFKVNKERIIHWIGVGAKPTDTVHNLLIKANVIEGAKVAVHKKSKKPVEVVASVASATPIVEATVAPVAEAVSQTAPVVETSEVKPEEASPAKEEPIS